MTTSRDFVTVDMRGLKAALEAMAVASKTSSSELVRQAVSAQYSLTATGRLARHGEDGDARQPKLVKVTIRLTRDELALLDSRRCRIAPSRAAVIAGLLAQLAVVKQAGDADRSLSELIASNAGLSTLARYLAQLCTLLQQGDGVAARAYRDRLEGLASEVRSHLKVSAGMLEGLRPRHGSPNRKESR